MAHSLPRRSFLTALAAPLAAHPLSAALAPPQPQAAASATARIGPPSAGSLDAFIPRLERALHENVNPFWFPRSLDREQGGYMINHDPAGLPNGRSSKMIVTQARMVWYFSRMVRAGMTKPATRAQFAEAAEHGFQFLRAKMWDAAHGGYFWEVNRDGSPRNNQKHLYGQSFALCALSEMAVALNHQAARDAAIELFELLERRAHDATHGGYIEDFEADWTETPASQPTPMGPARQKLMNTHLHLMEAFTSFYRATTLPRARERLLELITVESNTVLRKDLAACADKYTRDWRRLAEGDYARVSYGHDIENVWLLMDACRAAGISDSPLHDLYRVNWAYCLEYGWDAATGAFCDSGLPRQPADRRQKVWWVQAEALVSALKMYRLTGEPVYRAVFERTWNFTESQLIDWKHGEWHAEITAQGQPRGDKAHIWKAGYHNGRALVECLLDLRSA